MTTDSRLKDGERAEELRALLNAGHRRGATVVRCEGPQQVPRRYPVFAAVAIAGIGDLPDTITDRGVVVRMRRRAPHERVEPFRYRKAQPVANGLAARLTDWADHDREAIASCEPLMPRGIVDRPADVWEPLLAVAERASDRWAQRAREAAVALTNARDAGVSLGVQLLTDVRAVFRDAPALSTDNLLERLVALEESPWGDLRGRPLDARGLARRLRPFGVRPKTLRVGDRTPKGYARDDLYDAWARYVPVAATAATAELSATTTLPVTRGVSNVSGVADLQGSDRNVAHPGSIVRDEDRAVALICDAFAGADVVERSA